MCKSILGQELRWTGRRRLQHKRRWYSSNCRFQDQRRKRWCKLNIISWAPKLYKQTHPFFRNTVTVSATSASMAKCNGLTTIMGEILALPISNNMFFSEHNYTPFITFGWRNVFPHPHSIKKFLLWHRGLKNCLGEQKKGNQRRERPRLGWRLLFKYYDECSLFQNSSAKCQVAHQFAASDSFCNSSSLLYCENFCRRNDAAKRRFWIWERI